MKKVNELKSIQEQNNTRTQITHTHAPAHTHRKTTHNVHDSEFEVELVDKSTSGK